MKDRIKRVFYKFGMWIAGRCVTRQPACEHEGCRSRGQAYYISDEEQPYFYCAEHAHDGGFCFGCGGFFSGIERFDFSKSGLCDECDREIHVDAGDFDEEAL